MNKIITHTFIFLFSITRTSVAAQKLFGNEWIVPSQTYLRIPVIENGLYKITSAELREAGFPTDTNQSCSFQMFWRGKEVAIQVSSDMANESQVIFDGQRNDGALDSALYISPVHIPHAHYSLYSDTSAYFLTFNIAGIAGKRTQFNVAPHSSSNDYHFTEIEKLFISQYAPGNFYPPESGYNDGSAISGYDAGEGWTGPEIKDNVSYSFSLDINNPVTSRFSNAQIELVLVGRSAGKHAYELWSSDNVGLKRKIKSFSIHNFESITLKTFLDSADFSSERELKFTLVATGNQGSISLSYAKLSYPQRILTNEPVYQPELANILKPRLVRFRNIDLQSFDYLIITHPAVRVPVHGADQVSAYANYRASIQGGNFKPLIVHSEEVYNQFNYGVPGPLGIKNMISWMTKAGNLKFVFLIGRSVDPQTARKSAYARTLDMVPNAGWPGSDIALVMGSDSVSSLDPIVPIGRLNALTSQNVYDYLIKVKTVEAQPASAPWRKNILHLSGGRSDEELSVFSGYVKSFEEKMKRSTFPAHVETISKKTTDPVEKLPVHIPINGGASLITLFGHSSLDVTDIDIGMASDPESRIQNHPRYPAIIINGCAAGSIFYSTKTLSSDWIFSPNKGAVLFLAHTFNGLSTDLKKYTESFYEVLAVSSFTNESFGVIQNEAIRRNLAKHKNITAIITAQQMLLHGDPAIRIFPKDPTLQSGNTQAATSDITAISVSPNPSDHWFRFLATFNSTNPPEKANLFIYDLWGRKVQKFSFDTHSGKNEWFWHPENLPSGVYLYSLEIDQKNGTVSSAAQKALRGRLIWVH
ncbi:putative type IX secretion system sortase PorU2 [Dyadobacter fanqingshengii]|uniref:C25 family cysteine peptidase n=1 Tax=Dyadobacter fanqingshengii TaxID=2906443 RepID=A0A9X1T7J3_9BACT|nr:C25 family cysteine peptidase [Dyadobacter fanqingshengii]MCF0038766.1 C25 family cysteine peptidase [Dyadobacter fanqingshengii]USJ34405.1 C25 family cysteine peptidase [Dyadobacter fanqingshengii]